MYSVHSRSSKQLTPVILGNMHCDSLLIFLLTTVSTKQASADEDSGVWECKDETVVEASVGEEVKLVAHVSRLERCYFVFTEEKTGDQCCYSIDEFQEDCNISDKYRQRNPSKCLEEKTGYAMKLDSRGTGTCSLIIESLNEAGAGQYRSYDANHKTIQGCLVKINGQSFGLGTTIIVTLVATLFFFVLVLFILWKRGNIAQKGCCCTFRYTQAPAEVNG